MESKNKKEKTPVRDRWLIKMFSPPSISKISNSIDPSFCYQ